MEGQILYLSTQIKHFLIGLALIFLYLFLTGDSFAQIPEVATTSIDCSIPQSYVGVRPGPKNSKIPVSIGFNLLDLKAIDDVNQSYVIDVLFNVKWRDPRLSEDELGKSLENCKIGLEEIWYPFILEVNRFNSEILLARVVIVDDQGNVTYKQRVAGELNSEFNFDDFPFDTQILHYVVGAFGPDAENIVLELDEGTTGSSKNFSIEGWNVEFLGAEIKEEALVTTSSELGLSFSRVDFKIVAEREKQYYIWKVIAPLCFIVLMAWAVFWINPKNLETKIGLTTAAIFTLIAYKFTLSFFVPKVSYLSRLDEFVFFATVLVFGAFGIAVTTCKFASDGKQSLALSIEKWARPAYILLFIALILITLVF